MSRESSKTEVHVPRVPGLRHRIRQSPSAPRRPLWRGERAAPADGRHSPLRRPGFGGAPVLARAMRRIVKASFQVQ
jgi:hypothetical protein